MVSATEITRRQTDLTIKWHQLTPAAGNPPAKTDGRHDLLRLVEENHLRNFSLWHEEDIARRDDLGFAAICRAKRTIDRLNQERNNFIEALDQALVAELNPRVSGCPRHSETPAMIIDRLSICALKEYHMHEETVRVGASTEHHARCAEKLALLRRQREDLASCLTELLADVAAGRRTFSVYFHFKMYNDPALNPQLYRPTPPA